jgi:hypothetical protein
MLLIASFAGNVMKAATDGLENQVCRAENGQFIAFWHGNVVYKFDGSLRHFGSAQAAWDFLTRRDFVHSSIVGTRRVGGGRRSIAVK